MATRRDRTAARTFFLNESHELSPTDKSGGGRTPKYVGIEWAEKGLRIGESISRVLARVQESQDPLRDRKYFVVAQPVLELEKASDSKKFAPSGTYKEPTLFGGKQGRAFERLGLDLLQVTADGRAIVHGDIGRLEQLSSRARSLGTLGVREQVRWAAIDLFETVPSELRVDSEWLSSLVRDLPTDVVFELQPVLNRVDADQVSRAITEKLSRSNLERLTGSGTDFSGRFWFRGKASLASIRTIAADFFSVQSIHSPLFSLVAATPGAVAKKSVSRSFPSVPVANNRLPCVAVVDLGVPSDHIHLGLFCRGRFVALGASAQAFNDHASFVASRIVFGDFETSDELEAATATCSFYDAVVGDGYENRVNDKFVMDALRGVRGAAPDVRVFNLSIGDSRPLSVFPEVELREKRLLMQDLDNFVFANDVLVIVAAGNSISGVLPSHVYPNHHHDPSWALGPWAAGFNTLVCGSFVSNVGIGGLVQSIGWPSPFSRVGPGLCNAPIPSFGDHGGNSDANFQFQNGLGVWGFSGSGFAEDRPGTSNAAPILAREAALALSTLQEYCAPGSQPFAVAVRAFLALTATKTTSDAAIQNLLKVTLGVGKASAARLSVAAGGSAVLLWQGVIESSKDVVRVQLPVPSLWLKQATQPYLRLVVCYDPPVNEVAKENWACRKVSAVLHKGPETPGIRALGKSHISYPLITREYDLSSHKEPSDPAEDLWLLELKYEETFDYPPGMEFDPRQRVAFAVELIDRGDSAVDPQPAMQALPIAGSMNRLSAIATAQRNPVLVRTRAR